MGRINRNYQYYNEIYNLYRTMCSRENMTEICDRWHDFDNFYIDLINEYQSRIVYYPDRVLTLDRIDYTGIYEPSNCRIIPREAQASNKSDNTIVFLFNQAWTLSQIYREFAQGGLTYRAFLSRIENGWDIMDAARIPIELAYHKDSNYYVRRPVMSMKEIYNMHTSSQFLDPRDKNELFNYDPRNIEDIYKK